MTADQIIIFLILGGTVALFIWDRWRYDLVALMALFAAAVTGVVKTDQLFSGLADPAVTTVGTILILSAAISRSGFVDWCMKLLSFVTNKPRLQVVALVLMVMMLSAFMNNVGAMAVFLPIAIAAARKAGRPPSELLMPLAFGSLLGGLVTLIGTPPNIVISGVREQFTGERYQMFDFAPVGLGICGIGLLYLSIAWRLIPKNRQGQPSAEDMFVIKDYISEMTVPEISPYIGKTFSAVEHAMEADLSIVAYVRAGTRYSAPSKRTQVQAGDILIVESDPAGLKDFVDKGQLMLVGSDKLEISAKMLDDIGITEAVITGASEMVNAMPRSLYLRSRFGINLLAVRREGKRLTQRIRNIKLKESDVLVFQGNMNTMPETLNELGCLPLAQRNLQLGKGKKFFMPIMIMAAAVTFSSLEILPISVALLGGVVTIGLMRILRLDEMYQALDGRVIILLAAMIPVTEALQTTGGAELISSFVADLARDLPPYGMLTLVLVATMLITPFLNNVATVLLMGPIAATLALKLGLNIDAFLMAVAIGASCDFLTPIGHQSNTLVMGPGGYKFGDYWRVGLPLSILVVFVAVPLILMVWPLS